MRDHLVNRQSPLAQGAILLALCAYFPTGLAEAQSTGGGFTLRKHVIGAGVVAQGSPYRITATAAQSSAGVASGGSYSLTGGFHQSLLPGATDRIFCNGFENTACPSASGAP